MFFVVVLFLCCCCSLSVYFFKGLLHGEFFRLSSSRLFGGLEGAQSWRFCCILDKYLTENLFYNMKLLLQHQEENIKAFVLGRTNHN